VNQRLIQWMDLECPVTGALWFYRDQKILFLPLSQDIRRCLVSVHDSDYYFVLVKIWLDASHL